MDRTFRVRPVSRRLQGDVHGGPARHHLGSDWLTTGATYRRRRWDRDIPAGDTSTSAGRTPRRTGDRSGGLSRRRLNTCPRKAGAEDFGRHLRDAVRAGSKESRSPTSPPLPPAPRTDRRTTVTVLAPQKVRPFASESLNVSPKGSESGRSLRTPTTVFSGRVVPDFVVSAEVGSGPSPSRCSSSRSEGGYRDPSEDHRGTGGGGLSQTHRGRGERQGDLVPGGTRSSWTRIDYCGRYWDEGFFRCKGSATPNPEIVENVPCIQFSEGPRRGGLRGLVREDPERGTPTKTGVPMTVKEDQEGPCIVSFFRGRPLPRPLPKGGRGTRYDWDVVPHPRGTVDGLRVLPPPKDS